MFIALLEFLLQDADAMTSAFMVGMIGTLVLVLVMPFRAVWILYHHFRRTPGDIRKPGLYRAALLLLGLSVYGVLEAVYYFTNARGGEVSGVMIPLFSLIPFLFYVGSEVLYALSRSGHRIDAAQDQPT